VIGCAGEVPDEVPTVGCLSIAATEPLRVIAPAEVLPRSQLRVVSGVEGRLLVLPPPAGTRLHKGDLIARLDPAPFEAEVQRQRALFQEVEADVRRLRGLGPESLREPLDAEALDRRLQTARERLLAAERHLRQSRIESPVSGRISAVLIGEERLVAAGTTIVELVDEHRLDFTFSPSGDLAEAVAELDGRELGVRLACRVQTPAGWLPAAAVAWQDGRLQVRLESDVPLDWAEEMPIEVVMAVRQAPWLPVSAVSAVGGEPWVWLALPQPPSDRTRAERFPLRIGRIEGGRVLVLEGLAVGDRVILEVPPDLEPGDPVIALTEE
jgi:RND family efflux transporter MFP subunit